MQNMEGQERSRCCVVRMIFTNRDPAGNKPEKLDLVILQSNKALLAFLWQIRIDLLVYDRLPNVELKIGAMPCNYCSSPF